MIKCFDKIYEIYFKNLKITQNIFLKKKTFRICLIMILENVSSLYNTWKI